MTRKRGAPVLIELITRPSGPSVGGGGGTTHAHPSSSSSASGRGGSPVSNPDNWSTPSSGGGTRMADYRLPAVLIGAAIVIVTIAAIAGYQLGQKKERTEWAEENATGNRPVPAATNGGSVSDPLNAPQGDPNAALGGGVVKPPVPSPVAPTPSAGLQDGWNYLVVATLRRTDAEAAAQYLADNGIPVQLVPAERGGGGGVDRTAGGANNGLWQLWVLRGVPGAEYTARRSEREALETKVKLLGRTWKAQNRKAPTDFGSTYWVRYKA